MSKNTCVVYAPIETFSGYGSRSRDFVKALIELKKEEWDIKIISCKWGNCPMNFLEQNPEWKWLKDYIIEPHLTTQPDYMFFITVPHESQIIGKWNCLVTAGIETSLCSSSWLEGINRMDLNIVSSVHSKNTFINTRYNAKDNNGQPVKELKAEKPIEVLFEGGSVDVYQPIEWID